MGAGSFGRRWARIIRPDARVEVEEELAFHLAEREREYIARGMDAETARAEALERLGDVRAVQRECTALLVAERREEARRGAMAYLASGAVTLRGTAIITVYTLFMLGVCTLACIGPTRRALGVQPLDALREEV